MVFVRRSGRRCPDPAGKGLPMPGSTGQRALGDDSARCATTFSTSRRIALLPGRMTCQYAAKARLVFGSVARTRVSVLSKVPAGTGSRRNSIPALIHPGSDQARRAAASRCGGTGPPSRRQAWLRPAEMTTWGRSENSTGMGVTSRKLRPANGPGFLPESRAGRMRMPSSACPRGRADMVTRCRASHTAGSGARATREWPRWTELRAPMRPSILPHASAPPRHGDSFAHVGHNRGPERQGAARKRIDT